MSKICYRCGLLKNNDEFSKFKRNKDGLQNWCKECNKEYQKEKHLIKNNTWKLYRVVIDLQALKPNLEIGNPNDLQYEKMNYIGITKKHLNDRLNEHISAIKNRRIDGAYYWVDRFFKDIDLQNISLRKYVTIELVNEYPSETTKKQMKKYEKKAVWNEGRISYQEGKKQFGMCIPLFNVINVEHFPGSKNCKDMLINYDIIKQE